ncbi:O-antigen ligase family protein [Solitalea longa]|nr:O-antigen ligase family protein [Solitalea longa]
MNGDYWSIQYCPWILVISLLLIGFIGITGFRINNISIGKIDMLFIVFTSYIILSIILNGKPFTDKIYVFIGYFLFFFIAQLSIDNKENLDLIWLGLILILFAQAIQGVLQYVGVISPANIFFTITGSFINPGPYGGFLAVGPPILIYYCNKYIQRKMFYYSLICIGLFILTAIVLSGSRAAWIASIVGTLFMAKNLWFQNMKPFALVNKKILTCIAIAFLSLFLFFLFQLKMDSSLGRIFIWKISLSIFKEHPLFGIGYEKFGVEYGKYQAAYFQSQQGSSEEVRLAGMNYFTFNEYLKILIEYGITGFMLFVVFIYGVIKLILTKNDTCEQLIVPLSVTITILIFAFFSYPFSTIPISLLFFLSISIISFYEKKQNQFLTYKLPINSLSKGFFCLVLVFMVYNVSMKLKAIRIWQHAQQNLLFREKQSWLDYKNIYSLLDNNGAFLFNYGAELSAGGYYKESCLILNKTEKFFNSSDLHIILGNNYKKLKNYHMAEKEFITAHYMVPNLFTPLSHLFELYKETGESKKATEMALKIYQLPIKVYSDKVKEIKTNALDYLNEAK